MDKFEYGNWEYHPTYGVCSRLVFKRVRDELVLVDREYGPFDSNNVLKVN